MKLCELKEQAYRSWQTIHHLNRAYTPNTDQAFKDEARKYGDLRLKSTWETVFAQMLAHVIYDANDDDKTLIETYLILCPQHEGWWHLVNKVIDAFLLFPDGWEMLTNGFEQIYGYGCNRRVQLEDVRSLVYATAEAGEKRGYISPTTQSIRVITETTVRENEQTVTVTQARW
ncbi:MAG: hypothetical protein WA919_24310 [Coleofasciculaceae cyanobacterium]